MNPIYRPYYRYRLVGVAISSLPNLDFRGRFYVNTNVGKPLLSPRVTLIVGTFEIIGGSYYGGGVNQKGSE